MLEGIILLIIGLLLGGFSGYLVRKVSVAQKISEAEQKASDLINQTKTRQKELLLQAKDRALAMIEEVKKEDSQRRQDLKEQQIRLEKRESLFDKKLLEFESKQQKLYEKAQTLEEIKKKIVEIKESQAKKLEDIAGMKKEQALNVLLSQVERDSQEDILSRVRKLTKEGAEQYEKKAQELLTLAVQRVSMSHSGEIMTTIVDLPSDEMKGRIIGREGRNIKTIEQMTGVEIIVDDTPQAITISGFSPIRRQIAKVALKNLIADGRIHPARIEEAIEKAKKEIALEIKKAGEDAVYELGIAGLDPKLIQILGRLKYRTSYSQNVLRHSIEVAQISMLLAEELGADVTVAKKGGLLHDIGKAVDHEVQGGHPQIGYDIMKKFGLPEEVCYLALAHHDDAPKTLEGVICKVADCISGGRPGARSDSRENYLQRLEELEKVALSFPGVQKAYAIQAGREVRVFVTPEEIDDLGSIKLAKNIAHQIETNLKYPGEIKINIIRETRVIEYAR